MKKSLNRQFAFVFGILLAGTILLCWFLNSIFLEKYYVSNKQKALRTVYQKVNVAIQNKDIDDSEFELELEQICATYNIDMIVIDADSKTVKTTTRDEQSQVLILQLYDHLFRGIRLILQFDERLWFYWLV